VQKTIPSGKKAYFLREQLRDLLNAPAASDIARLKNTSEALSVLAYGLTWQNGDNIIITAQEFPSNRIVWESLQNQGVIVRQADSSHTTDPEASLFASVDKHTRLIGAVQYASGFRMDLAKKQGYMCGGGVAFRTGKVGKGNGIDRSPRFILDISIDGVEMLGRLNQR